MSEIKTKPTYPLPSGNDRERDLKRLIQQLKEAIRDLHEDLRDHENRIAALE